MTYEFSDPTDLGTEVWSGNRVLESLTNFEPGLAGFEGLFEGVDASLFCLSGTGLGDITNTRTNDTRAVVSAALNPGSKQSQAVGTELIKKSLILANLATKRDAAVNLARGEIQKLLTAIKQGDARLARLASKVIRSDGSTNPNADPRDVAEFDRAYAANKELGRRALRFQKVNALATVLRNNAVQQSVLAQQIAAAQAVGQPGVVAALATSFNTLGRESDKIRDIRQKQITRGGQGDMLEGLAFGTLDRSLWSYVSRPAKKVAKVAAIVPGVKQVYSVVNTGLKTVAKAAGTVLNAACKLATSGVAKSAMSIGGKIAGPIIGGVVAGSAGAKAGSAAGPISARHSADLVDAQCKAIRGLGLSKGGFNPRGFAEGVVKGAKTFAKKNLAPKQLLADATRVGSSFVGGSGGANAMLNQYGAQAIQQLGLGREAQAFVGQALKATQGRVTASGAGQALIQQFGGPVGGSLISKLQGNTLRNNAVAQAAGNALIQQASGASGSVSPFLQQVLGL